MRTALVLGLGIVVAVGCSSEPAEPATSAETTAVAAATTTTTMLAGSTVPSSSAGTVEAAAPFSVNVDVSVDSAGIDGELEVAIDPGELDLIDPFTRFSSCSGARSSVGTYVVTAVDVEADGDVRAVTVLTTDRVDAPGVHEADVRVEFDDREPVTAIGTMTLDDDLRSGSFVAFEAGGGAVEGSFLCDGPTGIAVPIDEAESVEGVLSAVEIVALLRRDDAERVVAMTLDTSEATFADARCPGVTGSNEPVLVSVAGDQTIGSINDFELTPDPGATMRMRVGGASYELDDVVVSPDPTAASGTFRGTTADGVTVDGAYRCS